MLRNRQNEMDQSEIIKMSLQKSVKDMDEILTSKVGHLLITFILINEEQQKLEEYDLEQENFETFILKLVEIQE